MLKVSDYTVHRSPDHHVHTHMNTRTATIRTHILTRRGKNKQKGPPVVTTAPRDQLVCACTFKTALKRTSTHELHVGSSSCQWNWNQHTVINHGFARLDFNVASLSDFGQCGGSMVGNVSAVSMGIEVLPHHASQHMADK